MKSILIAAVVLFALTQGSFAHFQDNTKSLRDYLEHMKKEMNQNLNKMLKNQELSDQAQTFLEDKQSELVRIQEQVRSAASSLQSQVQPVMDEIHKKMENIFHKLEEQARHAHK